MLARRALPRTTRAVRPRPRQIAGRNHNIRFQSTASNNPSTPAASHLSASLIGGLAGGGLTLLLGYIYYRTSGLATIVDTARETKSYFQKATHKAKESAPEPNEALKWLHSTATSYASFIPGARGYVDAAFNDLDAIQRKHGEEVEKLVKEAYDELKEVSSKKEMSVDTAYQAWQVIEGAMRKIGALAGDAASDILDNHPDLKEKVGGSLEQFKQIADRVGPKAKKQVDDTWKQISEIVKGGVSVSSAAKIRQLVQEKIEKVKELEAGVKELEEGVREEGKKKAKPLLEKTSEVKELISKDP